MSDIADKAEEYERLERENCIRQTLKGLEPSQPQVIEPDATGRLRVICFDCLSEIPPARLQVLPRAIRCVECEEINEKRERLTA